MVGGVVFDMDGLMFDTEELAKQGWAAVGSEAGYVIPREVSNRTLGLNEAGCREVFLSVFGADFPFEELRRKRVAYVDACVREHGVPLKPGLISLLEYLRERRIACAVATSTNREHALRYLEQAGVYDYFSGIVCGDMVSRSKPDPEIYLKACEMIGKSPDCCIALEDSPMGIRAAKQAGMIAVMIPDLVQPDEKIRSICSYCLSGLSEVIGLLKELA